MWHPVRGEALVSVSSIYNPPHPPATHHSLCVSLVILCRFFKISFTFRFPLFKNHFCVYLFCLRLSVPPSLLSLSPSLSACLSLSPRSLCVVLISDRHCSRSQRGTETAAQNSEEKRKHIGKHHSPDISLLFLDVFHLIFSHLPLSIDKNIHSESQSLSLSVDFSSCFWVATSNDQPNQEDGRILLH